VVGVAAPTSSVSGRHVGRGLYTVKVVHTPHFGDAAPQRISPAMVIDTALPRLAVSWERHLMAANRSPKTIRTYLDGVRQLVEYCAEHDRPPDPAEMVPRDIESFICHLLATRSSSTTPRPRLRDRHGRHRLSNADRAAPRDHPIHPAARGVNELPPDQHAALIIANLPTITDNLESGAIVSLSLTTSASRPAPQLTTTLNVPGLPLGERDTTSVIQCDHHARRDVTFVRDPACRACQLGGHRGSGCGADSLR
jgi:hypothetical protein